MKIFSQLRQMFQYLWGGTSRLFRPSDDEYPKSGVQPFSGEPFEDEGHTY